MNNPGRNNSDFLNDNKEHELYLAVRARDLGKVKFILRNDQEVKNLLPTIDVWFPGFMQDPLHHAACNGYDEIITELLIAGAKINSYTKYSEDINMTPLHCAVKYRRLQTIQMLFTYGANCWLKGSFAEWTAQGAITYEGTPLEFAETMEDDELVSIMLTHRENHGT